jgi:hypothetical protein
LRYSLESGYDKEGTIEWRDVGEEASKLGRVGHKDEVSVRVYG